MASLSSRSGDEDHPGRDEGDAPPAKKRDLLPEDESGHERRQDVPQTCHRNHLADRQIPQNPQEKNILECLEKDAEENLRMAENRPKTASPLWVGPGGLHPSGEKNESGIFQQEGQQEQNQKGAIGKHQ